MTFIPFYITLKTTFKSERSMTYNALVSLDFGLNLSIMPWTNGTLNEKASVAHSARTVRVLNILKFIIFNNLYEKY